MSDKGASSKGKDKMNSDDEETGEQTPSSSPSVPSGPRKQQETAEWLQEQRKKRPHISDTSESSQMMTEGIKIGDLDSDVGTEKLDQPIEELEGKGKRIKYSDEHQKETPDKIDNKTGQQTPSSSSSVSSGLTSDDLSSIHMFLKNYGEGSLEDLMKQQQITERFYEQRKKPNQISETSGSSPNEKLLDLLDPFEINFNHLDSNLLIPNPYDKRPISNKKPLDLLDPFEISNLLIPNPYDKRPISNKKPLDLLDPFKINFNHLDSNLLIPNPYDKRPISNKKPLDLLAPLDLKFNHLGSKLLSPNPCDTKGGKSKGLIFEQEISERHHLVIPVQRAYNYFPAMITGTQETLQLSDHHGHNWEVTLTYDNSLKSYAISTGWSLYLQCYDLNLQDLIRFYLPVPQLHLNHFLIKYQKKFESSETLFEVEIPLSNRLPIACELARDHFKPSVALLAPNHLRDYPIHLTDYLNQIWEMRYLCFEDEDAYVVIRGWEQYVARYRLRHKDTVRFCWKDPTTEGKENSFIIYHDLRPEPDSDSSLVENIEPPQFLQANLICELSLSREDVGFGRLDMPGVEFPFLCRHQEMVRLTDENSKNWYVIIVQILGGYMILDGWEGIVREHELEAGDQVRLYSPDSADHDKHFLIECFKKSERAEKRRVGSESQRKQGTKGVSCG